jgi:hypothetical protein
MEQTKHTAAKLAMVASGSNGQAREVALREISRAVERGDVIGHYLPPQYRDAAGIWELRSPSEYRAVYIYDQGERGLSVQSWGKPFRTVPGWEAIVEARNTQQ